MGDQSALLPGTSKELGTYRIELPPQTESKKVKVKAKLTLHGTFVIEGAQLIEEEEYEETVKEKREVAQDEATPPAIPKEGEGEAKEEGEKKSEEPKKEPEKKYEWVDVVKKKKRTKRTDLSIKVTGKPGQSDAVIEALKNKETAMQVEMKEIIETDEKRNDLEAYIFNMRDKISEGAAYGDFISSGARDKFNADLTS